MDKNNIMDKNSISDLELNKFYIDPNTKKVKIIVKITTKSNNTIPSNLSIEDLEKGKFTENWEVRIAI